MSSDWQPIETAPQNDTFYVLGRHDTGEPWWNIAHTEDGHVFADNGQQPTHWMPLPEPPQVPA